MDPSAKSSESLMAREPDAASVTSPARKSQVEGETEAVLTEIRERLGEGRFRIAQELARDASGRFPEHAEIRRLNRGLNEWQATTTPGSSSSRTEEFEWLAHPPASARGKWVALVGGKMVGAADTLKRLAAELQPKSFPKQPLVVRID